MHESIPVLAGGAAHESEDAAAKVSEVEMLVVGIMECHFAEQLHTHDAVHGHHEEQQQSTSSSSSSSSQVGQEWPWDR